jgi:NTP pyrophosphatase (non-canonical NTP hydrolase)
MEFKEYQDFVNNGKLYDGKTPEYLYMSLGLSGETGEVVELIKKSLRDDSEISLNIIEELGDVLWYLTALAGDLGYTLDDVVRVNVMKCKAKLNALEKISDKEAAQIAMDFYSGLNFYKCLPLYSIEETERVSDLIFDVTLAIAVDSKPKILTFKEIPRL